MRSGGALGLRSLLAGVVVVVVSVSCTRPPSLPVDAGVGAPADLAASLGAKVHGDTVAFTLHVSNPAGSPVRIEFSSAQRYDFEVGTMVGERVWKWSSDRGFAAALGHVELGAGESVDYSEEWTGARSGEYTVLARLTSTNKPVELRTRFVVPSH
jgi:hypothetical protein